MTDPQDMEAADEIIFQWSARTPSGRREWLAGVIAQARVDAERERDQWQFDAGACAQQRDALAAQVETLTTVAGFGAQMAAGYISLCEEHHAPAPNAKLALADINRVLAATPAASLIAHDNALIERCAAIVQNWIGSDVRGTTLFAMAAHVRALKTDSEGSTT